MTASLCWGAHAPTRARDDALVIALFVIRHYNFLKVHFGGGAEISTRGACAPQNAIDASPLFIR